MRLWHKTLIQYLPRQQLIAQWRECCAIARSIAKKGKPNHILVNKVLSSRGDFYAYCNLVVSELKRRNYNVSEKAMRTCFDNILSSNNFETNSTHFEIFSDWHNNRYLRQCLFNLQEKYDCGGIPEGDWKWIQETFERYFNE